MGQSKDLPPVLELRGIHQTYFDPKKQDDFVVFDDFNLAIEDYPDMGQFIVIMGKSGCGKSTLLRSLNRMHELTAIARVAFERLTRSESYRVTVHPQFASAVTSVLPGNHLSRVQIDQDPNCALGTLIIHSGEGTIDASIDAQLEEISRGLTDRLASS